MENENVIPFDLKLSIFPTFENTYPGSIPSLMVSKSKYSSTESDLFSSDDNKSVTTMDLLRPTLSGFSTSAASSSESFRNRRKRRQRTSSRGLSSCSSLNLSAQSSSTSKSTSSSIITDQKVTGNKAEDNGTDWIKSSHCGIRTKGFPLLNSVKDLKHAIGRRRGISGSVAPSADAALFAMFYLTDIFDDLLNDPILAHHPLYQQHSAQRSNRHNFIQKDLLSLLRNEIVYSLRTNYFCPASKIVKLVQLIENHYPLSQMQDVASFLDLLFRELLKQPPFLSYANGCTGFIHSIELESYLTSRYYQPVALTLQQLLRQKNIFASPSRRRNGANASRNFGAVPYPALILNVIRGSSRESSRVVDNDVGGKENNMYYWDQSSETHHHSHKRPVIPSLKIDISELMSRNDSNKDWNRYTRSGCNWNENISFSRGNQSVLDGYGENKLILHSPSDDVDKRIDESRIFKGIKSAWNVMFKYLEDLTASSGYVDVIPHECVCTSVSENKNKSRSSDASSGNPSLKGKQFSPENNYSLSRPLSSLSLSTSQRSQSSYYQVNKLEESFTPSVTQVVDVKMELVAIICQSQRNRSRIKENLGREKVSNGGLYYSVYSKAGRDVVIEGEKPQYAPWVMYESRNGIAPQVVLIENFGKWMVSLEKHHESFSLYQVPMEIRRVLEDSQLFIYKRFEK